MHYKTIIEGDRVLVGYGLPGAPGTLGIVGDYPLAAKATAQAVAERLNAPPPAPYVAPDARPLLRQFGKQLRLELS